MRYTGWTIPSYNQSQQQYSYTQNQNSYPISGYPQQGQSGQYPPYQGQYNYSQPARAGNDGAQGTQAAYYDATRTEAQDGMGFRTE